MKKNYLDKKDIIMAVIIVIFSFLITMSSPQMLNLIRSSGVDSSVFRYIGKAMCNHYIPYRDIFDHKGLLLYFINMLGYLIGDVHGIWLIELISLSTAMFFTYLAANKLLRQRLISMCIVIVSYSLLYVYFQSGNFTEEYFLPFISISFYLFVSYFIDDKISNFKIGIIGACFSAILLIRPNGIGIWAAFCFVIFVQTMFERNWKEIYRYILWFAVGMALFSIPFIVYMLYNNIVKDFFDCYIIFNMKYTFSDGGTFRSIMDVTYYLFSETYVLFLAAISLLLLVFYPKRKSMLYKLIVINFLNIILNIYLIGISGRGYAHYGMTIIPSIGFTLAVLMKVLGEWLQGETSNRVILVIETIVLIILVSNVPSQAMVQYAYNYIQATGNKERESELISCIIQNSSEDDKICVIGNKCNIYLEANRYSSSKYIYQVPIALYDARVMQTVMQDIKSDETKLIVICIDDEDVRNTIWPQMSEYVESNYRPIYQDDFNMVYAK